MGGAAFSILFFGFLLWGDEALPIDTSSRSITIGNLSKWENVTVSSSRAVSYTFNYNPQKFANKVRSSSYIHVIARLVLL